MTRTMTRLAVGALVATGLTAVATGTAQADPPASDWAKLRMCESSNRYDINTGTGYYGAYQFDLATWQSVGGKGYPNQASPAEQDYRALYLYRMRGWQPWECANGNMLGLVGDKDGGSHKVPSRADAAYIGGGSSSHKPKPSPKPSHPSKHKPKHSPKPSHPSKRHNPKAWPHKTFKYGDCNDALRPFQLQLNKIQSEHKFHGSGCYAKDTKKVVLALQKANHIKASGIIGPKTWKAAFSGKKLSLPGGGSSSTGSEHKSKPKHHSTHSSKAKAPAWSKLVYAYGDCNPALRTFQLRMNAYHFAYHFRGTGCYYKHTKHAVLALQRANGIRDSGRLGPKTWKAAWEGEAPN